MPTISKLPNGRWKAIVRFGRRSRSKVFSLKSNARAWAAELERDQELAIALNSPGAGMRLAHLAELYLDQWEGKDACVPSKVAFWVKALGQKRLTDINANHIRQILNRFAGEPCQAWAGVGKNCKPKYKTTGKTRKPATVNRMQAQLSALFAFAKREGFVTRNPCSDVAGRREDNKVTRWLDDDERKRLLAACRGSEWPKLHLLVVMALSTGARLGELQRLRGSDIDYKARTAMLRDTKNGEDRVLTIPPSTIKLLLESPIVGNALIFGSDQRIGRPFNFRPAWTRALKAAGIERFRFHDLRHSAASYLAMNGASLLEIAEVLGHRSLQTTQRYAHLSTEHKQKLTDRVLNIEG